MIAAGVSNANANPSRLWLCIEEGLNSFDQVGSRASRFGRMKIGGQQNNLHVWICLAEFFKCGGTLWRRGPADCKTRMRAGDQNCGIRQQLGRIHFTIAALEERAEISQEVAGAIDTDDSGAGTSGGLMRSLRPLRKSRNRFGFRRVGLEDVPQIGGRKKGLQKRRQLAKFEIAAGGAEPAEKAHHGAQAAAIDITHLGQLQNELLGLQLEFFDLRLQRLRFFSNHNSPVAADEHDVADSLALTNEVHGGVR